MNLLHVKYAVEVARLGSLGKASETLDSEFEIPMLFIRSGLAIPVDTSIYTDGIETSEEAKWFIDKTWFDIDNQSDMDW